MQKLSSGFCRDDLMAEAECEQKKITACYLFIHTNKLYLKPKKMPAVQQ